MGPRRTNLALLIVLVVALATGGLAFAAGTGWGRPVVVAHGLAGLAVLVLAPWKSVVVRRGLARRSGAGRWASVAFGVLVLVAVAAGLAHATGALAGLGPVSAMQVHVGAALVALPLLAWHAAARGGARARRTDLSRRALLRAGVVAGGAGLLLLAVEGATRLAGLPGARRRFTGSLPVAGTDPRRIPVTQWLDDRVQVLDPAAWRLRVTAGRTRPGTGPTPSWPASATGSRRCSTAPAAGTPGPPGRGPASTASSRPGAARQRGRHLGHRLPAPPPPGRRRRRLLLATRLAGRPLERRPRLPGPPGRPRPPRLLVGQVGRPRSSSTRPPGGASRRSRSPDPVGQGSAVQSSRAAR